MIKFFRKIRQNLFSEGKTGKYLKYAFGEIVLVVIGILIALQINNWNEERKLDNRKQEYYSQLLDDLNSDIIFTHRWKSISQQESIVRLEEMLTEIDTIVALINEVIKK